jgi:hypothetical protein
MNANNSAEKIQWNFEGRKTEPELMGRRRFPLELETAPCESERSSRPFE